MPHAGPYEPKWKEFIRLPDVAETQQIAQRNVTWHHVPQVYGLVDGTHITVLPPPDRYRDYVNRNGSPSIILQAVVDDPLPDKGHLPWSTRQCAQHSCAHHLWLIQVGLFLFSISLLVLCSSLIKIHQIHLSKIQRFVFKCLAMAISPNVSTISISEFTVRVRSWNLRQSAWETSKNQCWGRGLGFRCLYF